MPWAVPTDGPEIATEVVDLNPCPRCGARVLVGAPRCPRCNVFTPGHAPSNRPRKGDITKIFAEIVEEFCPQTPSARRDCRHLARVECQLNIEQPGSQEFQRNIAVKQELIAGLMTSRPRSPEQQIDPASMTYDEIEARLLLLLAQVRDQRDAERRGEGIIGQTTTEYLANMNAPPRVTEGDGKSSDVAEIEQREAEREQREEEERVAQMYRSLRTTYD